MNQVVMTPDRAPDDIRLMVEAWLSGSDTQRAVALDLADRNRAAAMPEIFTRKDARK